MCIRDSPYPLSDQLIHLIDFSRELNRYITYTAEESSSADDIQSSTASESSEEDDEDDEDDDARKVALQYYTIHLGFSEMGDG